MAEDELATLLDGPMGTQLQARGIDLAGRAWSARALESHPEVVAAIHRDYAEAGATVHTTATFRTTERAAGATWEGLARRAVQLGRGAIHAGRLAGCVAPLEDCYRPDRSPRDPGPEHRRLIDVLVDSGVDLLLLETFPHPGEALAAVRAAVPTGLETWLALTAGPSGDLMTPSTLADTAHEAARLGATTVFVDCVPARSIGPFVDALARTGVPFGVYANAGTRDDRLGWGAPDAAQTYADLAERWLDAGASVVGGCCGTGPEHIRAIAERMR